MKYSRRNFALLLPAIAAAQDSAGTLPSKAYKFADLPAKVNEKTGSIGHSVFDGRTYNGYPLAVHITELPAGASPHPPHKHEHEEMFMIQTGVLEVMVNGKSQRIGAGSLFYVHSMEEHGVRNPGTERVQYFVTEIGAKS